MFPEYIHPILKYWTKNLDLKEGSDSQLTLRDWFMLIGMTSVWLLCLLQHLPMVMGSGEYLPAFNPAFDRTEDGTPVLVSVAADRAQGGDALEVGDRLLEINQVSLAGISPIKFQFEVAESFAENGNAVFTLERQGEIQSAIILPSQSKITWSHLPPIIGYVVIALLVLIRAPHIGGSRLFFGAFMSIAIFQTGITAGSGYQVVGGRFFFIAMGMISFALVTLWVISFPRPDKVDDPKPRVPNWVAFIVPILFPLPRLNYYVNGPLAPEHYVQQTYFIDGLFTLLIIGILSWNYYCADLVNRRKIRWVLMGVYLAFAPILVVQFMGVLLELGDWFYWVQNFSLLFYVAIPVSLFMAMRHFNLFDVDRLISGSLAYTFLIVVFALLAEGVIEPIAASLAIFLRADADTGQLIFVGALAALAIPIQAWLRPKIEVIFFPGSHNFRDAIENLVEEVASENEQDMEQVALMIGTRVSQLLDLQECGSYIFDSGAWVPVLEFGSGVALRLDADGSYRLKRMLERRVAPIRLKQGSEKESQYADLFPGLNVELIIPLRSEDDRLAFVALGAKRSQDVYTNTDLTLLAGVAAQVALNY